MMVNKTDDQAVTERLDALRRVTTGMGIASRHGSLPSEDREALGVLSFEELRHVLHFIQAKLPQTGELEAVYNALNLQSDQAELRERREKFVLKNYGSNWIEFERNELVLMEFQGLKLLATVFPAFHRDYAASDDGK